MELRLYQEESGAKLEVLGLHPSFSIYLTVDRLIGDIIYCFRSKGIRGLLLFTPNIKENRFGRRTRRGDRIAEWTWKKKIKNSEIQEMIKEVILFCGIIDPEEREERSKLCNRQIDIWFSLYSYSINIYTKYPSYFKIFLYYILPRSRYKLKKEKLLKILRKYKDTKKELHTPERLRTTSKDIKVSAPLSEFIWFLKDFVKADDIMLWFEKYRARLLTEQ